MLISILEVVGVLMFLVLAHEFGHYLAARRNGVKVEEFGIGFPPRLWGYRPPGSDTLYSLNLLPLGGFVRLKGEGRGDTGEGTLGGSSLLIKTKIFLAGIGMNLLVAYLLLVISAWVGLPQILNNQFSVGKPTKVPSELVVTSVAPGPLANAGLQVGNIILAINGKSVKTERSLSTNLRPGRNGVAVLRVIDNNESLRTLIAQRATKSEIIGTEEVFRLRYGWQAPIVALGVLGQFVWVTISALATFAVSFASHPSIQAVGNQLTGPIGITHIWNIVSSLGIGTVIFMVLTISLSLAVMNALPIPPLDGGGFALTVVRHLTKGRSARFENIATVVGVLVVILLGIVVTWSDISHLHG